MKKNNFLWGGVLIIIGILFLGNSLSWWNTNIFFKGWWTLFIIVPSVKGLIKKEWIQSILGLAIGLLLLGAARNYITWQMVGELFVPFVFIVIGLSLIVKPKEKKSRVSGADNTYLGIFSGCEEKLKQLENNTKVIAVFGGVDLDLTDVNIKENTSIECITVFGGIDIKLPKNVNVITKGVPIFGGIENKNHQNGEVTITINYVSIFGGIDLI